MSAEHRVDDSRFVDEVAQAMAVVSALPAVQKRVDELQPMLADLESSEEPIRSGLIICLVGSTGAGKSTLINALAGSPIAQEGVDRPTTSVPTLYAPDDVDLDTLPNLAVKTVRYRVADPSPWGGHVFVDAPDVNSVARAHRDVTDALAQAADVLLVVMHHQSVAEASAVEFLDKFQARRHWVFVLGRCDELSEVARSRLRQQIETLSRTRWGLTDSPVFLISAKNAQHPTADSGDFEALVSYLRTLENEGAATQIRRSRLVGAAHRLAGLFEEIDRSVGQDVQALEQEVQATLARVRLRFVDFLHRRLAHHRTDLEFIIEAGIGRQWSGPAGWVFRVTAISKLWLGLVALVGRGNPLLVGSVMAGAGWLGHRSALRRQDQLQRHAEDSELSRELVAWIRTEQVPLEALTARLALPPPALADWLPPIVEETLQEDWVHRLARELPAALGRAFPPLLRRVVSLPLFVLALWVLIRAGLGLFSGDYVGIDFVVSVLIIAVGWLYLSTQAVRWQSRRVAKQQMADMLARMLIRFDEAAEPVARRQLEDARRVQRTLDWLKSLPSRGMRASDSPR